MVLVNLFDKGDFGSFARVEKNRNYWVKMGTGKCSYQLRLRFLE